MDIGDTVKDLENLTESSFLDSDEIAMIYDENKNVLISPFYSSLFNLMKELKLEPVKKSPILPINDSSFYAFYSDGHNLVALKYEIRPVLTKYTSPENEIKKELLLFIHMNPKVLISGSYDYWPRELNLTKLVKNYNKNALPRVLRDIYKVIVLRDSIESKKENEINYTV